MFLLSIFILALTGCTPEWRAVFINGTDDPLGITLLHTDGTSPFRRFRISPDGLYKSAVIVGKIVVSSDSGIELFTKQLELADPDEKYSRPGERLVYLLVTKSGIYPVPLNWRGTWQAHQDHIINQTQ